MARNVALAFLVRWLWTAYTGAIMNKVAPVDERADLIRLLEDAQARIRAGEGIDYDPQTFRDRLIRIYRSVKR